MSWAWVLAGTLFLGLCGFLFWAGRTSEQNKERKRLNKELNKEIDAIVEAGHKKEKAHADHEKRVADIIRRGDLSLDRINGMLRDYPPESEAARAIQQSGLRD